MSSSKVVLCVSAVLVILGAVLPSIVSADLIPPSGLAVWLDAQDVDGDGSALNNPTDGTAVGTWVDKASIQGTQSAVQTTGTLQPLYYSNVLNGQAAIRFDGSDYLAAPDVALGPFTYFSVFKATTQYNMIYERGLNAAFNNGEFLYTDIVESVGIYRDTKRSGKNATPGWGNTSTFLLTENSFNGTHDSNSLFINGGQVTLSTADVLSDDPGTGIITDTLYVGNRMDQTYGLNGDLAELLVFNRVLTNAERNTVGSYLADKYGLTTAYVVPEPNTLVLSAAGLFGLLAYAWRKRK